MTQLNKYESHNNIIDIVGWGGVGGGVTIPWDFQKHFFIIK